MGKFSVQKKICKQCGHCVAVCPAQILKLDDKKFPIPADEDVWEKCMGCGHCVVICPVFALSIPTMNAKDCPPLLPIRAYTQEKLLQLFSQRRSVRHFTSKVIPQLEIEQLLEVAELAPSAVNEHPVSWISISGRGALDIVVEKCAKTMEKANNPYFGHFLKAHAEGKDLILRGCANVIIAHGTEKHPWSLVDGVIATTHLDLAASLKGFGTCWAGLLIISIRESKELQKYVGIPNGHVPTGALMLGYPKFRFHHIPERKRPEVHWIE